MRTLAISGESSLSSFGRHVFGAATLAFGLIALAWHDDHGWLQLHYFVYAADAALILGGIAIQFRRTAKTGAPPLAQRILSSPFCACANRRHTNGLRQLGQLLRAVLSRDRSGDRLRPLVREWAPETLHRVGRICLGVLATSFALEQAVYLSSTAGLVPKWVPPSQMFWAVATTVSFALAALALLSNRMALLAIRLLTMMVLSFGIVVWIPLVLSDPQSHASWSEIAETFAIAGAAWILADVLGESAGVVRRRSNVWDRRKVEAIATQEPSDRLRDRGLSPL